MRKMGNILLDMEKLLDEMVDDHDLQWSDVLGLVYAWLMAHRPDAREEYVDGDKSEYYYGPIRRNE